MGIRVPVQGFPYVETVILGKKKEKTIKPLLICCFGQQGDTKFVVTSEVRTNLSSSENNNEGIITRM